MINTDEPNCMRCGAALTGAQELMLGFCGLECVPEGCDNLPIGPMMMSMFRRVQNKLLMMERYRERAEDKLRAEVLMLENELRSTQSTITDLMNKTALPGQAEDTLASIEFVLSR